MPELSNRPLAGHHRPWLGATRMFAAELLLVPTGLITAGVLTRQLGSATYGEYVVALAAVAWVQYTATALLARATNRVIAASNDWRPLAAEILRLHAVIGVLAALLVYVTAPMMAGVLKQGAVTPVLRLLAVDVLLTVMVSGYRGVLVSMGEHGWLSLVNAARWLVRMVAIVGFVQAGWSLTGVVLGIIVSSVVVLAASAYRVGWLPGASAEQRAQLRGGLLTVAAPTALAAICLRLFERGDVMLLSGVGADADVLGEYGAAQNLTLIVGMLGTTLAPIVLSSVTRHLRDANVAAATAIMSDAVRVPFLVLPFAAIGMGGARDVLALVYGAAFADAAVPFAVLALAGCAMLSFAITSALLIANDRAWWVLGIAAPMLLLLVALGLGWAPRYAGGGAAAASLVPSVLAAIAAQVALSRVVRLELHWAQVLVCVGIALLAGAGTYAWPSSTSLERVLKLAVMSLATAAALVLSGQIRLRGGVSLS